MSHWNDSLLWLITNGGNIARMEHVIICRDDRQPFDQWDSISITVLIGLNVTWSHRYRFSFGHFNRKLSVNWKLMSHIKWLIHKLIKLYNIYTVSVLFIGCKDVISVADYPFLQIIRAVLVQYINLCTRHVLHQDKIERLCEVYNKPHTHTILRFHQ